MSLFESFIDEILKNKAKITNASTGTDFEERVKAYLKKSGFSEMAVGTDDVFDRYVQEIKPVIQKKTGQTLISNALYASTKNKMYKNCYRWQPYGQQDYPDFLIFTEHKVFSMESKYSTKNQSKPMWNSNLPKMDGIYLFGVYGKQDLTVFRGEDVLSDEERKQLVAIWDKMDSAYKDWETDFIQRMSIGDFDNKYGFSPYVRKAYSQGKTYNEDAIIDFLKNKGRDALETSVKTFIRINDIP